MELCIFSVSGFIVTFRDYEKNFRDRGSVFMTLEIILILLTIVLAVYFLFRPTSKKEKDRFEDKDNWRGGF